MRSGQQDEAPLRSVVRSLVCGAFTCQWCIHWSVSGAFTGLRCIHWSVSGAFTGQRCVHWSAVRSGNRMSSTFSPPSYLSFGASAPGGRREERGAVPFLLYPSPAAPLRGPGLLPSYLGPFLPHGHFGVFECALEPAFIQKRNERERQRVRCVNRGYAALRDRLPGRGADKRLSKVETLRAAIRYIAYLQGLVEQEEQEEQEGERREEQQEEEQERLRPASSTSCLT
ncbi:Achaete-scute 5 [Liparis tanakae]|uniref:Achaete-scute 5 n=1 Tax=Liparis tanakae TaxID=230148 RepID=A0A4Z2FIF0_9TELE|nr:Achaete-scute 5 [Liparis tanakae]